MPCRCCLTMSRSRYLILASRWLGCLTFEPLANRLTAPAFPLLICLRISAARCT
jgi:hypothetical protein